MRIIPYLADGCVAVSKSDSVVFTPGTVFVGTGGTATIVSANGSTAAFLVPTGGTIPVLTKMIMSTGTTATGFVVMY